MDHLDISNTVDSTVALRVVEVATTDVSTCSVFLIWYVGVTENIGCKNFRLFSFYFGLMLQRLFIITESKDSLCLQTR